MVDDLVDVALEHGLPDLHEQQVLHVELDPKINRIDLDEVLGSWDFELVVLFEPETQEISLQDELRELLGRLFVHFVDFGVLRDELIDGRQADGLAGCFRLDLRVFQPLDKALLQLRL